MVEKMGVFTEVRGGAWGGYRKIRPSDWLVLEEGPMVVSEAGGGVHP